VIPGHEVLGVLASRKRSSGRIVLRSRYGRHEGVTRVIGTASRIPARFGDIVRQLALSGKGTTAGLPEDAVLVLEGYRAAARARHLGGLPRVLDAGVLDGRGESLDERLPPGAGHVWVTTSWVEGQPLDRAWEALDDDARDQVLRGILGLLDAIHDCRVAYGDLKPSNVIVGRRGVSLIDLDTMREVAAAEHPAVTRDLTPRYAAPEQQRQQLTYLSSDLYAFGSMAAQLLAGLAPGAPGFPPSLRAPWDRVVAACLRADPLARPPTRLLCKAALGRPVALPGHQGSPPSQARSSGLTERVPEPRIEQRTERVPEPPAEPALANPGVTLVPGMQPLVAGGATERVPEPEEGEQGAWPVAGGATDETLVVDIEDDSDLLTPARWSGARPGLRAVLGLGGALFVALLLATGVGLFVWQLQAEAEADRMAGEARATLQAHKTVVELNNAEELEKVVAAAGAACAEAETPDALGVLALAHVWQQRWHWWDATWNAEAYAESEILIARALDAGRTVEALVAKALLTGAACRLMEGDEPQRAERCEQSRKSAKKAARLLRRDAERAWLLVELHWGSEAMERAESVRLLRAGEDEQALKRAERALEHCEAAAPLLDAAPVNGVELAEDCVGVAGRARDLSAYLAWAQRLVSYDLELHSRPSPKRLGYVFQGALPQCAELSLPADGLLEPAAKREAQDPRTFCAYMGRVALGCSSQAYEVLPYGLRLGLVFPGYVEDEELPWKQAFEAAKEPPMQDCALSG